MWEMLESVFKELDVWIDCESRSGAENMAIDELLYERQSPRPVLRFYDWRDPAVSFGYFEKLETARASFSENEIDYIRRLTGGGVVDHREGSTYTLFIPKSDPLSSARGDTSYCAIHKVLVESLADCGVRAQLADGASSTGENACFVNPVAQDVVSAEGVKLAGAGQKRGRYGLLHQGCVVGASGDWRLQFARKLAQEQRSVDLSSAIGGDAIEHLCRTRYASEQWLNKR